nr:basic salivary proline-rich protein 1-like [Globicephala melas]
MAAERPSVFQEDASTGGRSPEGLPQPPRPWQPTPDLATLLECHDLQGRATGYSRALMATPASSGAPEGGALGGGESAWVLEAKAVFAERQLETFQVQVPCSSTVEDQEGSGARGPAQPTAGLSRLPGPPRPARSPQQPPVCPSLLPRDPKVPTPTVAPPAPQAHPEPTLSPVSAPQACPEPPSAPQAPRRPPSAPARPEPSLCPRTPPVRNPPSSLPVTPQALRPTRIPPPTSPPGGPGGPSRLPRTPAPRPAEARCNAPPGAEGLQAPRPPHAPRPPQPRRDRGSHRLRLRPRAQRRRAGEAMQPRAVPGPRPEREGGAGSKRRRGGEAGRREPALGLRRGGRALTEGASGRALGRASPPGALAPSRSGSGGLWLRDPAAAAAARAA